MIECRCSLPLTSLLIALLSNPHTPPTKLLSQNHHPLQAAPGREVSADAGQAAGRAEPRNPLHLETEASHSLQAQVPTRNGCFPRTFCWTKWSVVERNLFICVGVVSRALMMTFL